MFSENNSGYFAWSPDGHSFCARVRKPVTAESKIEIPIGDASCREQIVISMTPLEATEFAEGINRLASIVTKGALPTAIDEGAKLGKMALYFGCWNQAGHFLHDHHGRNIWDSNRPEDLPWNIGLMDTGLLKNGKIPDIPDGRVHWTCGGDKAFWYAFYWWDRSVDQRGACNSGFYVRGFGWPEAKAAFEYACAQFPYVVKRQKYPLVLNDK